ncbi:MAG TPA: histidine kinase dimerization/phospho-acceptor domain-containing protein, partial [Rhodothermales bacterium]|nr:histidine kinase dimerization/phospho-acceptor domain-containing protein [Rhodothermales bacterium]
MRSLHRKIEVSYLVLVGITVAISTFSAYHFSKLGTSTRQLLQENYRSVQAAEGMVKSLERQENAQLTMQYGNVEAGRRAFISSREDFFHAYEEAWKRVSLQQESTLLDSISASYEKYLAASDSLYALASVGGDAEQSTYKNSLRRLADGLRQYSMQLLQLHQNAMVQQQQEVENLANAATKAVVVASVLAVLLSLVASLQFVQQIVRPIEHLTNSVRRIGRGQLSEQIEITTEDEIAELGREFNKMTERLAAFEAMNVQKLIAEKKKSESLVAALPNPVILTDEYDRLLLLNEAAIQVLQVQDGTWQERYLLEVALNDSLAQHLSGAIPTESDEPDPVLPVAVDGSTRYYRRRLVLIRTPEGHVDLKVVLLEDVTHFKELDQLKSDFLAAVSHELRTPLTSLGMALDLMQQEVSGLLTDMQRELLETASEDNERLKKFVEALLALARLEAGMYHPERARLDLDMVIQQAAGGLRLPFSQSGVALEVNLPAQLPPISGDPEQLGWVVTNLVGNALRHT